MPLRLVTRAEWGARGCRYTDAPSKHVVLDLPVDYVLLQYYSRCERCQGDDQCKRVLQGLQNHHMDELYYNDIKFSFMVGADGTVYEGRGWHMDPIKQDHRLIDLYGSSIDIAFLGDFQEEDPPKAMQEAVKHLVYYGMRYGFIKQNHEIVELRRDMIMPIDPGYMEAYDNAHMYETTDY